MFTRYFKTISLLSVFALVTLLAGGCKENSTTAPQPGPNPTIVSFTANPTSVTAPGDSVTLSWKVSDATSLSISPGVGDVTPADSGSKKVFVSSSTTFTLTATNSAGTATATTQVNASLTMTVNGIVQDIDGEPVPGVTVIVKGKTPTTTNASGGFTISDVAAPYEIRLIISTAQTAIVYQNLTRSDPTIIYTSSTTTSKSATISGTVPFVGGTTQVFFVSGEKAWSTTAFFGSYTLYPEWKGSVNSYTGKLYVLRWTAGSNGLPNQYDAYGSEDNLTISAGGTFGNHNFTANDLTDPAEQNISGSITRPTTGYSTYAKQLYINFGNARVGVATESGANLTDNFSYIVPAITGATFEVDVYAQVPAVPNNRTTVYRKKGISGGASGITINLESAPQLNLPANNGTGIDTTTQFLWTKGSGTGVCFIIMSPTVSGTGPTYYILSAGNTTSIPNLNPQGLGLPANLTYKWNAIQVFPLSSIDDAASASLIPVLNGTIESGTAISETFNFTTHP